MPVPRTAGRRGEVCGEFSLDRPRRLARSVRRTLVPEGRELRRQEELLESSQCGLVDKCQRGQRERDPLHVDAQVRPPASEVREGHTTDLRLVARVVPATVRDDPDASGLCGNRYAAVGDARLPLRELAAVVEAPPVPHELVLEVKPRACRCSRLSLQLEPHWQVQEPSGVGALGGPQSTGLLAVLRERLPPAQLPPGPRHVDRLTWPRPRSPKLEDDAQ
mmetsp:Transcript_10422/g.28285  ORF Transcript_10422/g.28285 Transcript_10422/m.28285 type:complete len:220 (+) Transcript_10422:991-1650(+)